jgi:hypothetical protein
MMNIGSASTCPSEEAFQACRHRCESHLERYLDWASLYRKYTLFMIDPKEDDTIQDVREKLNDIKNDIKKEQD